MSRLRLGVEDESHNGCSGREEVHTSAFASLELVVSPVRRMLRATPRACVCANEPKPKRRLNSLNDGVASGSTLANSLNSDLIHTRSRRVHCIFGQGANVHAEACLASSRECLV